MFLVVCMFPLLWLILNSFKTQEDLFTNTWGLPKSWTLNNYVNAVIEGNIGNYFINSLLISVVSVSITIFLSTMTSYGITRLKWKLSGIVLSLFLMGMMIPTYGSIIPLYSIFNMTHILGKYIAVIIPNVTFAIPMSIFIMTGFFSTLPRELEEAAIIDGCSLLKAFWKVIMPLVKPGIITIAVISFINAWNDLLFPQIFLSDQNKMTLPVGLMAFKGMYATDYVGMIAAIVITVIPVIVIYSLLHQRIIGGLVSGAVKG
ncbi:carbohydrate ABC transporter permease [Vallitalea pronyensis]|uniref:Carbohydrate ABC transporter permease n=2 Tax=Vallitalea pronyensis TaxID=1348613 RepID=A0A8J8SJC3_9FIRM|nr:carbohydrate ABC transporter permease [Vallitalea pronyensis]